MPSSPHSEVELQPRFRVRLGDEVALGPGKADLLEGIAAVGSIAEAAKQLGMSYMRAWTLVKTMNRCFRTPLVAMTRGGTERGGAQLTPTGRRVLELYRSLEQVSRTAVAPTWEELQTLVRPDPSPESATRGSYRYI